jgi:hypothetical protein
LARRNQQATRRAPKRLRVAAQNDNAERRALAAIAPYRPTNQASLCVSRTPANCQRVAGLHVVVALVTICPSQR